MEMNQTTFSVIGIEARLITEFRIYHNANPQVWDLFQQFTFEAINMGRSRYGSQSVIERIRWYTNIETADFGRNVDFKISNNHVAFYARMFHDKYPEHDKFFRIRPSAADEKNPAESSETAELKQQVEMERPTAKAMNHV